MTVHAVSKRWKSTELGEAAYLAYQRDLDYRRNRSRKRSGLPPTVNPRGAQPAWDDLSQVERSAWSAAAVQVAKLTGWSTDEDDDTAINALEIEGRS